MIRQMAAMIFSFGILASANVSLASGGWNILQDSWDKEHFLDFVTIEWEYFMIHDNQGRFNGVVGYVLTNPRLNGGALGMVVPEGGNVAVGGQFNGDKAIGNYINFGGEGTVASQDSKNISLKDEGSGVWATMEELEGGGLLKLKGQSEDFVWDLDVRQSFQALMDNREKHGPFTATTDAKTVGYLPGERWTVDALWPKTKVQGWVINRRTGEKVQVDGKGYRENSWGRYLLSVDGWDFLVFSEDEDTGLTFVVQTYHKSKKLDFLDLGFIHNDRLKRVRFDSETLSWEHRKWKWNDKSHQCIPQDWHLRGEKDGLILEAEVHIDTNGQEPFLSNKKLGTKIFFIHEQYPTVEGRVLDSRSGKVLKTFKGRAGGEFAYRKGLFKSSDSECAKWGAKFSNGTVPVTKNVAASKDAVKSVL